MATEIRLAIQRPGTGPLPKGRFCRHSLSTEREVGACSNRSTGWAVITTPTGVAGLLRSRLTGLFDEWIDVPLAPDIDSRLAQPDALVPRDEAGSVVLFGRSAGARVVSTFAARRAVGAVICLNYPFRLPNRQLEPQRFIHLAEIAVPTLIVQGSSDEYGGPDSFLLRRGVERPGLSAGPLRRSLYRRTHAGAAREIAAGRYRSPSSTTTRSDGGATRLPPAAGADS